MHKPTSSVLLAAGLCAIATAQAPPSFDGFRSSAPPAPAPGDDAGLGGGAPATRPSSARDPLLRRLPSLQEPDYSLEGLFQQAHGDFMLKRERYNPMLEARAQFLPSTEVKNEPGSFDLLRGSLDLEVPITVATDGFVTVGTFFDVRNYATSGMPNFADEDLYSAGLKLGFGWFLDENLLLEGLIAPGSWSDWDGTLHSDDFDYPAKVLLTIRNEDDLYFKVGVRYNEIFEEANVLPYLGVAWRFLDNWRLDVLAPEMLELSFWPTPDLGILLGGEIQGAEYHVRSSVATGKQRADTRVQEVIVYGGAMWRATDLLSFGARVGAVVAGDYKLDDGDPGTAVVRGMLDPALFLELSFGLDF